MTQPNPGEKKAMTNATMDPPLPPVLNDDDTDTPDLSEDGEDGDDNGRAYLVTFVTGGYEVVLLADTDDEEVDDEDLLKRFDDADRKGATYFKIGRRRIRMSNVNSFGPESEVDYPEVTVFNELETRTKELLAGVGAGVQVLNQTAHSVQYLVQQQAALQEAQRALFEEEVEDPAPKAAKKAGALRPMKLPGTAPL